MRYTVWQRPARHVHLASLLSTATAFHLLLSALSITAPLLLAYRSQGFWIRTAEYEEQADIHFSHSLLLLADLASGDQLGWSSSPHLTAVLGEGVRVPVIRSREDDVNRDGIMDRLEISVTLPLRPEEEVVAVNLLLLFDVRLHKFSQVQMTGMLLLAGSGFPGSAMHTMGDCRLSQRSPLAPSGRDTRYTASPIQEDSDLVSDLRLTSLLSSYSARNLSLRLAQDYTVWSPGRGAPQFTVSASLHYPVQTVTYRPGVWQVLKWGWVQYLSFLLVSLYLAARARDFVFGQQVLPTLVNPPWKQ